MTARPERSCTAASSGIAPGRSQLRDEPQGHLVDASFRRTWYLAEVGVAPAPPARQGLRRVARRAVGRAGRTDETYIGGRRKNEAIRALPQRMPLHLHRRRATTRRRAGASVCRAHRRRYGELVKGRSAWRSSRSKRSTGGSPVVQGRLSLAVRSNQRAARSLRSASFANGRSVKLLRREPAPRRGR